MTQLIIEHGDKRMTIIPHDSSFEIVGTLIGTREMLYKYFQPRATPTTVWALISWHWQRFTYEYDVLMERNREWLRQNYGNRSQTWYYTTTTSTSTTNWTYPRRDNRDTIRFSYPQRFDNRRGR